MLAPVIAEAVDNEILRDGTRIEPRPPPAPNQRDGREQILADRSRGEAADFLERRSAICTEAKHRRVEAEPVFAGAGDELRHPGLDRGIAGNRSRVRVRRSHIAGDGADRPVGKRRPQLAQAVRLRPQVGVAHRDDLGRWGGRKRGVEGDSLAASVCV